MAEHAEPESQRRADPAPAVVRIQRPAGRDGDDPYAGYVRTLLAPLTAGEVGHLVTLRHQLRCEIAVPALRSSNGVRVEAVVNEADAHAVAQVRTTVRYHRAAS